MSENIYNPGEQFFGWTRAVNRVTCTTMCCITLAYLHQLRGCRKRLKGIKEIAMMNLAA